MEGESSGTSEIPNSTGIVDIVFKDYEGRRKGLLKALTTDFADLYAECHCTEMEFLCLFGLPNGTWEIREPDKKVPPEIPNPLLGINDAISMEFDAWNSMVAIHSDSWLTSVAYCKGAKLGFKKKHRQELFEKMNALPTLLELITNEIEASDTKKRKRSEENETSDNPKTSTSRKNPRKRKMIIVNRRKLVSIPEEPERSSTCGACGVSYGKDGYRWITCDDCERLFHVNCIKILPVKAESIKIYRCPFC